jgi:polyisoprenyl-phosphate glycosyltransferase
MSKMEPKETRISVVIPAFNESECLNATLQTIQSILNDMALEYEILVVDDGSTDETLSIATGLSQNDSRIRVLSFSHNRGHMRALEAGLLSSKGEFVVSIDADLQDDPRLIPEMYAALAKKDHFGNPIFDVSQSVRTDRSSDSILKKWSAKTFYKLMSRMTGTVVIQHAADYRMIRREALDIVNQIPEREKVYRLLLSSLGFRIHLIETKRRARQAGKSKYGLKKMFGLAINSLINFSNRPLRLIIQMGFVSMFLMIFFCCYSVYLWTQNRTIPGWTSLVVLILISNSLILISLGVVGEYVGKIFEQVKGRPNTVWTEFRSGQKNG